MQRWRQDFDLACVRDKGRLALLPAAERAAWHNLWAEVADVCDRAADKRAPVNQSDRK
jgi:hypothetical protein